MNTGIARWKAAGRPAGDRISLPAVTVAAVLGLLLSNLDAQKGVGAPPVASQTSPVRDQTATPPTTGTASIGGTVMTDEASPGPIPGAVVEANSGGWSGLRRQAITGDTGAFELPELPAGRYTLWISKPGFVRTYHGARAGLQDGLAIAVTDGQRITNIAVRMPEGAVITGRVTDEAGRPIEQVYVYVLERREVNGTPVFGRSVPPGYSDDRGSYRSYGLRAGQYIVLAGSSSMWFGSLLPVMQGRTGDSTPLSPDLGAARTFVPVYYPGTPDVGAATIVTMRAGEERAGVDFTLPLAVTSRLSGTIGRSDGLVPAGAQLYALPVAMPINLGMYVLVSAPRATVNPDGTFAFAGLVPGRYTLAARAPSGRAPETTAKNGDAAGPALDLWASADLTVSGADISGLSLTLQPGMRIAGRVAFDGKTPAPPGAELAKGSMRLTAPPTPGPTIRPPSGAIRSDGSFAIDGIAPGRYGMSGYIPGAIGDRSTWVLKSITAGGRDLLDTPVDMQPGVDVDNLVVTFTDRVSEITGVVIDQAGQPAPEFHILVFSVTSAHWRVGSRRVPAPARPASDGRYRIQNLPPGEYYLAAIRDFDQQEYATPAFLEQVVPGAIKITIGEGEQKTQDVRLGI